MRKNIGKLIPDPKNVGEFLREKTDFPQKGFLNPNNWVFHDQIVKEVLNGNYFDIMPYSAEFVTTMNCSNRCNMCSYKVPKIIEGVWGRNNFLNPNVHMQSIGFAKDLLDKLIDAGIKGLIFTGGGEPSLFSGLENLVEHVTERGVDSVVYTNGNSLSKKRTKRIVKASPLLVRISLNAGTEEVYNKFHNPINRNNAFLRVLNTIEYLAKSSQENPIIDVGVSVVINEINGYDLVEIARGIKEIAEKTGGGIDSITYRPEFNYYGNDQLQREILDETYHIVENDVRRILEGTPIRVSNLRGRYKALKEDTRDYDKCRASGLYTELSPSGKLHLCCDRNCHRDYVIGDLTKNALKEIWRGEERKAVLDKINFSKCANCPPACKPHKANKQFNNIEKFRRSGEIHKVKQWIEGMRRKTKPKMINF